jgi:hypothetical protein
MGRTACTEPQCLYKGVIYLTLPYLLYTRDTFPNQLHVIYGYLIQKMLKNVEINISVLFCSACFNY